ncbi:MAG: hypothetical protein ABIS17_03465 [Casimicrobiaceae bacterium]
MTAGRWIVALLTFGVPASAFAHIKWFVAYNLANPPRPAFDVVSGRYFVLFCLAIAPFVFVVSLLDRHLTRRECFLHRHADALTHRLSDYFPLMLRVGVSVFFAALFTYGCFNGWMILTPELHTHTQWICGIQLAIAVFAFWRRTGLLAAAGIVFLYGYAVLHYGVFHMLDYPIFLGVAGHLAIDSLYGRDRRDVAQESVRICAAVTLLWASIEKFAFPEWSFLLLNERPAMTFTINPELYMVAAGFVEFCAAYLLLTGMLAARMAALVLLVFFVGAIIPFGTVDAIGHSVIIVVLSVLVLSNNTVAPRLAWQRSDAMTATLHTSMFFGILLLFMVLYYGGYYLSSHEIA